MTGHGNEEMNAVIEEKLKAREERARREYPETHAAFARVREAATAKIFATRPGEREKREELYRLRRCGKPHLSWPANAGHPGD